MYREVKKNMNQVSYTLDTFLSSRSRDFAYPKFTYLLKILLTRNLNISINYEIHSYKCLANFIYISFYLSLQKWCWCFN